MLRLLPHHGRHETDPFVLPKSHPSGLKFQLRIVSLGATESTAPSFGGSPSTLTSILTLTALFQFVL